MEDDLPYDALAYISSNRGAIFGVPCASEPVLMMTPTTPYRAEDRGLCSARVFSYLIRHYNKSDA